MTGMALASLHVLTHSNPTTNNQIGMHGYRDSLFLDEETHRDAPIAQQKLKSRPASPNKYISMGVTSISSSQPPLQSEASEMQVAMRTK